MAALGMQPGEENASCAAFIKRRGCFLEHGINLQVWNEAENQGMVRMEGVKQAPAGDSEVQIRREKTHASFSVRRELSQLCHTGGIYVTRNNLAIIAEFTDGHVNVRAQERNAQ